MPPTSSNNIKTYSRSKVAATASYLHHSFWLMLALVFKDWWSFSVCVACSALTCTYRVVASGSRTHSLSHGKHDALNYCTHANVSSQAPLALVDLLAADAAAADGKHDSLNYCTHANARSQAPLALVDLLAADSSAAAAAFCVLLLLIQCLLWLLLLLLRLSSCRIREE